MGKEVNIYEYLRSEKFFERIKKLDHKIKDCKTVQADFSKLLMKSRGAFFANIVKDIENDLREYLDINEFIYGVILYFSTTLNERLEDYYMFFEEYEKKAEPISRLAREWLKKENIFSFSYFVFKGLKKWRVFVISLIKNGEITEVLKEKKENRIIILNIPYKVFKSSIQKIVDQVKNSNANNIELIEKEVNNILYSKGFKKFANLFIRDLNILKEKGVFYFDKYDENILIKDRKNIIRMCLFPLIENQDWNSILFSPSNIPIYKKEGISSESLAGVAFYFREEPSKEKQEVLSNITSRLFEFPILVESHLAEIKHALRSAVAAIMARNMSHNIGSHVLNNLSDPDLTESFIKRLKLTKKIDYSSYVRLKDILFSKFQDYLRERMDLVAAIPTNAPIWCLDLEVNKDIIERLSEGLDLESYEIPTLGEAKINELFLLFDNIVQSEGITAEKLEFIPSFYEHNQKPKSEPDIKDLKASIYGGVLGTQCFFIILENFIRNSAKFGSKEALGKIKNKKNPEKLKIYIDFYENWDNGSDYQEDFIKVELYDNLGGWPRKKETKEGPIEEKIKDVISPKLDPLDPEGSLVDEEGKIREGNWGSKEMRIAASYIRGIPIEEIEIPISGEPDIIKAFPVVEDQSRGNFKTLDGNASLGYRFFLKKPKSILIISTREDIKNVCYPPDDFKAEGISVVSYDEFKSKMSKFTHEFFILDLREEEALKLYDEKNLLFPIKTLFIYDVHQEEEIKNKLKKYFRKEEIISKFMIKFECIENDFWIKKFMEKSNLGKKESFKNLCNNFSKTNKFRFNILVKWNRIFSTDDFNVSIYDGGRRKECLTGKYNLNLLHPPISDFSKWDYKNYIKSSKYLGFFCNGIENIFKQFKNAFNVINRSNFDREHFDLILKAFETSLYNFIIIDERVFESHERFKSVTKGKFKIGNFWYMQNVVFFNMEKDKKDNIIISYYPFEWDDQWNNTPLKEDIEPFFKKTDEMKFEEILPSWFEENVHFMIVHIAIIDKIGGKGKFEEWIRGFLPKYKPWFLIIDSGRGHPESTKIPGNARFQDFSNLRKYVIEEPDKYILSNVILNARE